MGKIMPLNDQRWLSVEEIEAHCGMARDSVCRWIAIRGLPEHRVRTMKRLDVDAWVHAAGDDACASKCRVPGG